MTIEEFQALVLLLANQMFVRYYLALNYPIDWKRMGLQVLSPRGDPGRLNRELTDRGFHWDELLNMWTIERIGAPEA